MKRALVILALAFLATGLVAQTPTQTLENKEFGVFAKVVKEATATKPAGTITKPVYLKAYDQGTQKGNLACANTSVGLKKSYFHFPSHPGAYLTNYGRASGKDALAGTLPKSGNQVFKWTYKPGKKVTGVVKAFFSGYAYGGGKIGASITVDKVTKTWANNPKLSRFYFKHEFKVTDASVIVADFTMAAGALFKDKTSHYNGHLSFYFYQPPTMPKLTWKAPLGDKKCAAGSIGKEGEIGFNKKFFVTLSGATDAAATKPMALLLVGNNIKNFFFFTLPFDLSGISAKDCYLYTNIVSMRMAPIVSGGAKIPFTIPGYGFFMSHFKPVYFQYAYTVDHKGNQLGLVFTKYGQITKD